MSDIIVQKYGGSSLSDIGKIRAVATKIRHRLEQTGGQIVAVVSAMGNQTNELLRLAHSAAEGGSEDPRELDALLATGELVSASAMSLALNALNIKAVSLSGLQAGIHTEARHVAARIDEVDVARIEVELEDHAVVVVAGFQGVDDEGDVTTLGRGGSDTTAVVMAVALGAKVCEIYTDVDGIYTADPRICPQARKLDEIGFEEMLELSSMGTKMSPCSIELGAIYDMPIYVASTYGTAKGTTIHSGANTDMRLRKTVTGIAVDRGASKIAVLGVKDRPGVASSILSPLAKAGISVDVIVQNTSAATTETDFTFSVAEQDAERSAELVRQQSDLQFKSLFVGHGLSKVSVVGTGMLNSPGYAATMFDTLAKAQINIDMISTSEIRITCVILNECVEDAVNALHAAFGLEKG